MEWNVQSTNQFLKVEIKLQKNIRSHGFIDIYFKNLSLNLLVSRKKYLAVYIILIVHDISKDVFILRQSLQGMELQEKEAEKD